MNGQHTGESSTPSVHGNTRRSLSTAMLPELVDESLLPGATAVIIDVLRASTTIVHALAHGAKCIIPCLTVDETLARAAQLPAEQRLLGGERHGVRIAEFDLGNSPAEYTPERVAGRKILFTTTNGTRALHRCLAARRILIGGFVNLSAVVRELQAGDEAIVLTCAGTDGQLTAEDILCAGSLVEALVRESPERFVLDLGSELSRDFVRQKGKTTAGWRAAMLNSRGGANLVALGYESDIDRAMAKDLFDVVPAWDPVSGALRLP